MGDIADPSSYGLLGSIPDLADGRSLDLRVPTRLPREISSGVFWLGACSVREVGGSVIHSGNSAYLIVGGTRSLLVDTGYVQNFQELSKQVDQCLAGRRLDYIMPTHPELPHSGSLGLFLERYPDSVAIGDMRDYHLYYPDVVHRLNDIPLEEAIDLGGAYSFRTVEPILKDLPNTRWGCERSQRVLFVADGFAHIHRPELFGDVADIHLPGECGRLSAEGDEFPTVSQIQHYTSFAFYWSRYRDDSEDLFSRFEELVRRYDALILAPSHGNPILDLKRVISSAREGHKQAYLVAQKRG
jgi:hypothetical protein